MDEAVYILGELEIWKLAIEKMKTNRYVKQDNGWYKHVLTRLLFFY